MILDLKFLKWMALVGYCTLLTIGCAVHYYEEDTGIEHIWGVGHMKMKASKPREGLQAVVYGADTLGVSVGKAAQHGYFLTAGWQRFEFIDILKEGVAIRLERPDSTFANVRVGSKFPGDRDELSKTQMEKMP